MTVRRKSACLQAAAWASLCLLTGPAWALPFLKPKVTTEYDRAAPLTRRTYSWGGLDMAVPQYEATVRSAADKYLQARGWQLTPSGGSEVVWGAGNIRSEADLEQFYARQSGGWGAGQWSGQGLGAGWAPGYGQSTISALATPENHLVLDVFDSGSHRLIFRGVTAVDFSGSEKKNRKQLAGSLKSMLKKFPPKK